ncbi:MAG: HAD family phosphatase [Acetatifactor sp.]|nr:HAD family phosphatase [Acetatifactor sp.]
MRSVIFDMDGILFDTEKLCMDSWIAVADRHGLPDMEIVFPKCIGTNANDSKEIVLEAYGRDFDYDAFKVEASKWFWDYIDREGLPIKPGVKELLAWMKAENWEIGLASSTKRSSVLNCLEKAEILDYFKVVITGDMVEHSKPLPDIYLIACEKLGVDPRATYAIEDSPNGIRSAHAAGMFPLMVPDLIAPTDEMRELSTGIFKDLYEVQKYLAEVEE